MKKGCLHDDSDDGSGPGTYSSQQQALVPSFCFHIMSCIIDVDVISGHHHLREAGEGKSPFIKRVMYVVHAMAPLSEYVYHKLKSSVSLTLPASNNSSEDDMFYMKGSHTSGLA